MTFELGTAGCYFIEKAYNAEKAGFKGILIYDNTFERLLTMAAPEDRPEIAKLADDISIPTALLTQVHKYNRRLFTESTRYISSIV